MCSLLYLEDLAKDPRGVAALPSVCCRSGSGSSHVPQCDAFHFPRSFLFSILFFPFFFLFYLRILFIFRERGREGDREGEKHQCEREALTCCFSYAPRLGGELATQACALTFRSVRRHQPTEPHWSGLFPFFSSIQGSLPALLACFLPSFLPLACY